MRGKDINLTVLAGMSHVREIKALTESGETWPIENVSVAGELWDVRMDGVIARLECRVTEEGIIEVRFPEMEAGRYIFAVDGVSDDGQIERIIEGYIGYEGPEMAKEVINEVERGTELQVYIGKEVRRALFGRNKAWEEKYRLTQEVAEQLNEVDSKLERAERLNEEFDNKLRDFVVPNESTETWHVGGRDTGKPYKGEDGVDGRTMNRTIVSGLENLPAKGDKGTYYYVDGHIDFFTASKAGEVVYMEIESMDDLTGVFINGEQLIKGGNTLEALANFINVRYESFTAEVASDKALKMTATEQGVTLYSWNGDVTTRRWLGYQVYLYMLVIGIWEWVNIDKANDLLNAVPATTSKAGVVRLDSTVTDYTDRVPTSHAVSTHVRHYFNQCVVQSQLDDAKAEVLREVEERDYVKQADLPDFVTDAELQEAIAREHSGLVSSAFGKKIVELSETEYSLLENPDEDTYYLTFAD